MGQLARARSVGRELEQVERLIVGRRRGDDGRAVGAPRRRDEPRSRIGGDDPNRVRFRVDENDLGRTAEPMPFDGDGASVRRPLRRVELRAGVCNQRGHGRPEGLHYICRSAGHLCRSACLICRSAGLQARRALGSVRLQPDQHEVPLARTVLHAHQRPAVRGEIRIEQARLRGQLTDAAVSAREDVEIAVEAGVSPQLELVEIDPIGRKRGRRSEIAGGEAVGLAAARSHAVDRGKAVGVDRGVNDVRRAASAPDAVEPRPADREALMRQPRDRRIRSDGDGSRRQACFVVAPQITERLLVDMHEGRRGQVRDATGGGLGERRQRLGAKPVGEVLVEAEAVRVNALACRPIGQAAVDPVDGLETSLAGRLANDGAELAGMETAFSRDRALFISGQPLHLPERQEQIRECVRRAPEDVARDARPPFGSIEMHDVRELVREQEPQPVIEV